MTNILKVNYMQIYETNEKNVKEWILIIYDISANHYVGVPVYSDKWNGCKYYKSINKYVNISGIADYSRTKMNRCIYIKRKPLKLSKDDYDQLLIDCKKELVDFLNNFVSNDINGVIYTKWCRDKYIIDSKKISRNEFIQNAIYWVDFGVGVGSELRKLRPAILWRTTGDNNLCTMIPLTTKRKHDKYYFHYDLECLKEGTAKIENMMNLSPKRILSPYFSKNKLAIITVKDYKEIIKAISKYYLFK